MNRSAYVPTGEGGGILLPFTTCRRCIGLRKILKEPWFTCGQCDMKRLAELEAQVQKETKLWIEGLLIPATIVLVFVGLMVFANVARLF